MIIPTVGRIVHYTNLGDADGKYPPEQQAAIITGVKKRPDGPIPERDTEKSYVVDLNIFYRTGQFHMLDVPFSEQYERGHWSWMPYQLGQAAKTEEALAKLGGS